MRHLLTIPACLLLSLSFAAAQPNFSGIWKMDAAKSDWGPQSEPKSVEYVIRHVGSKISFNYIQDGKVSRVDIIPDNEERITSSTDDRATWTRAYWAGDVLVLEARERMRFGAQENVGLSWTSRWALSPDRKEFMIDRVIRSGENQSTQKIVFERQPLPPGK